MCTRRLFEGGARSAKTTRFFSYAVASHHVVRSPRRSAPCCLECHEAAAARAGRRLPLTSVLRRPTRSSCSARMLARLSSQRRVIPDASSTSVPVTPASATPLPSTTSASSSTPSSPTSGSGMKNFKRTSSNSSVLAHSRARTRARWRSIGAHPAFGQPGTAPHAAASVRKHVGTSRWRRTAAVAGRCKNKQSSSRSCRRCAQRMARTHNASAEPSRAASAARTLRTNLMPTWKCEAHTSSFS